MIQSKRKEEEKVCRPLKDKRGIKEKEKEEQGKNRKDKEGDFTQRHQGEKQENGIRPKKGKQKKGRKTRKWDKAKKGKTKIGKKNKKLKRNICDPYHFIIAI